MNRMLTLWMQPIYAGINQVTLKSKILIGLIAFLYWGGGTVVFYKISSKNFGLVGAIGLSLIVTFGLVNVLLFIFQTKYIALQYSPSNAFLTPYLKTELKKSLIIPILLISFILFIFLSIAQKQFSPLIFSISIIFFLSIAATIRNPWMIVPIVVVFQLPAIFNKWKLELQWEVINASYFALLSIPISLAILWIGTHWIFSMRDQVLFSNYEKKKKWGKQKNTGVILKDDFSSIFSLYYFKWMEFCVSRFSINSKKSFFFKSITGFCLGPRLHWQTNFIQFSIALFGGGLMMLLISRQEENQLTSAYMFFATSFIVFMPVVFSYLVLQTMYQTRGEQSIVSLSPLTKNNQTFDMTLMKFIARQMLIMYSITFFVAVLGIKFASKNSSISFHTLILFFCTLPLMIMIFRNHAETKSASDNPLMAYSLLCLALIIILELIYFKL